MRVDWDLAKDEANQEKHGLGFGEAAELFTSGSEYLEIVDEHHSFDEDRFIAIGPIRRGVVLVVWTERDGDTVRIISALPPLHGARTMNESPELDEKQFGRALKASVRKRLMRGEIDSGDDVIALRKFVGLTQVDFAKALGISVHTLRNWEQGRRSPEGPALALLRIAARHPRIVRENLSSAA